MLNPDRPDEAEIGRDLSNRLSVLRDGFARNPAPTAEERIDLLDRLQRVVFNHRHCLISAIDQDFGGRAKAETLVAEIFPVLEAIRYTRRRVRTWMKPSRRRLPLGLIGARADMHVQPLGVVGIVVPWNFPVFLALSPLISALAAGNRVMIKTSEFAPQTSEILQAMVEDVFSADQVSLVGGGPDLAAAFTRLPFDHLVFTGSTEVGRKVMRSAAETLTPVTLELGGKSPAIVHESFPIAEAARRIAFGKGLNAGQACVAPDYVLVPRASVDAFRDAFARAIAKHYPTMAANGDYTAIISDRQRERLLAMVDDARDKGALVTVVNPVDEAFEAARKMPMHIVTGVQEDMHLMREEIFGPILPVLTYDRVEDAISYVNARQRPLALYYFDWDRARAEQVLGQTHSGG
ncbi:MAG: coniferyl aldehyde dehydrogenase, partial [Pseudomonadota bacterium]